MLTEDLALELDHDRMLLRLCSAMGIESDPTRFVTWCCMQNGKTWPSPTMSDVPHALAPRMLPSHPTWSAW